MTIKETLKQLKALGSAQCGAQNAKSAPGTISSASVRRYPKLAKKIRKDHPLALSLWETGKLTPRSWQHSWFQPKKLSAKRWIGWCGPSPLCAWRTGSTL